ncbi:HNH endonuclease [Bradyrhizobium sp. USDA 4452]
MGDPPGFVIDHVNGDTLDNRRMNLRIATVEQNAKNRRLARNNTSGVTGVYWHRRDCRWTSCICLNASNRELGQFETFDEAVAARRAAEKVYFGEFARLS